MVFFLWFKEITLDIILSLVQNSDQQTDGYVVTKVYMAVTGSMFCFCVALTGEIWEDLMQTVGTQEGFSPSLSMDYKMP